MTLLNIYILTSTFSVGYFFFRWSSTGSDKFIKFGFLIQTIVGVLLSLKVIGVPLGIN